MPQEMFGKKEVETSFKEVDLTFFLHQKNPFSTSIYKSDYFRNNALMVNLIGSLVKTDNAGKYNLYLAKKLQTTLDKKTWIFTLRDNLSCENGEKITAASYAKNLTQSLKRYSRMGQLLEFKKLSGANELDKWDTTQIPGITYEANNLILKFDQRPEQLFERLADRYFGYICSGNFEEDNYTWKDESKIISSGPYRIHEVTSEWDFTLIYRKKGSVPRETEFKKVRYKIVSDPNDIHSSTFVAQLNEIIPKKKNVNLVGGVPTFTVNLSLPIWEKSIFQNIKSRKYFFFELYNIKQKTRYNDTSTVSANSFFPLDQRDYFSEYYKNNKVRPWMFEQKRTAVVSLSTGLPQDYQKLIIDNLKTIGQKMNFEIELYDPRKHQAKTPENIKPFDIRITSVDMDAIPYFSLLDMIFCSELGVRYSDNGGRVCKFINQHINTHNGPLDTAQREQLHKLILDNGLVMPLAHRSLTYMYSDNIDLSTVSASGLHPVPNLLKKK